MEEAVGAFKRVGKGGREGKVNKKAVVRLLNTMYREMA